MGDVLGGALTPPILDAWGAAYWQLANLMIAREDEILQHADGWTDWREFRIARKEKESDEITSFYLEPVDGKPLPSYLPGQYISILTDVPKLHYLQSRQYSLSDAPKADYYRISVKREKGLHTGQQEAEAHPGYMSNIMHEAKNVGDVVRVSHPAGEFFFDPAHDHDGSTPLVLISAGVGLTPMVGILNTLVARGVTETQRISFIHGARSTKVQAFGKHIRDVTHAHPNISASIFIKSPDTATDAEGMDYHHSSRVKLGVLSRTKDLFLDSQKTKYYVCGPDSFMADMEKSLREMGVEEQRINMEVFGTGAILK